MGLSARPRARHAAVVTVQRSRRARPRFGPRRLSKAPTKLSPSPPPVAIRAPIALTFRAVNIEFVTKCGADHLPTCPPLAAQEVAHAQLMMEEGEGQEGGYTCTRGAPLPRHAEFVPANGPPDGPRATEVARLAPPPVISEHGAGGKGGRKQCVMGSNGVAQIAAAATEARIPLEKMQRLVSKTADSILSALFGDELGEEDRDYLISRLTPSTQSLRNHSAGTLHAVRDWAADHAASPLVISHDEGAAGLSARVSYFDHEGK